MQLHSSRLLTLVLLVLLLLILLLLLLLLLLVLLLVLLLLVVLLLSLPLFLSFTRVVYRHLFITKIYFLSKISLQFRSLRVFASLFTGSPMTILVEVGVPLLLVAPSVSRHLTVKAGLCYL